MLRPSLIPRVSIADITKTITVMFEYSNIGQKLEFQLFINKTPISENIWLDEFLSPIETQVTYNIINTVRPS